MICYSSFIHPFIHSFIHSFIHPSIHSFIHSFIHSSIHSFIHSFNQSIIHRLNRESRIDYCNDLANGVVLFTASAKILLEYGSILLNNFPSFVGIPKCGVIFHIQVNCSDIVYKGICQLFHVMERFLSRNSINRPDFLQKVIAFHLEFFPFIRIMYWRKYLKSTCKLLFELPSNN